MRLRYLVFVIATVLAVTAMVGVSAAALERPAAPQPTYDRGAANGTTPEAVGPYPGFSRKNPDFPQPDLAPTLLKPPIECFDFDDNGTFTGGFRFIPPDPHVAVGPNHVINIGNVSIEWRTKDDPDPREHLEGLVTFFGTIPGPGTPLLPTEQLGTFKFDPKVIYDQYAERFVVVALEQWDSHPSCGADLSDESRILVAVSKTSDPNLGWWFHVIDSKAGLPGSELWADYPGIAVDDKALYITNNMFPFCASAGSFLNQVWIVDKAPTYAGPDQSIVFTVTDPVAASGAFYMTLQPAHMYGLPLPVGSTGAVLGTYLIGYSNLTFGGVGGIEVLNLIEITDPLGAGPGPLFTAQIPSSGDIEDVGGGFGFPPLPDAPQLGGPALIEVNDSRTLNAVWRDECLYTCATIRPNSGTDIGQTTAHWWRLDTTVKPAVVVADQGDTGAEDLGTGTYTFFPSVMVDCAKNMAIGFSASNPGIFGGAYYASRYAGDAPGTTGATCVLAAGLDYYLRTFCGPRNRWGDYSGLALCPVDEATFWVYNEYAGPRGTPIDPGCGVEDGRWHTKLGCFRLKGVVAVAVTSFEAIVRDRGVDIHAEFISDISVIGVNVYRGDGDNEPTELIGRYGPMEEGVAFRHTDTDVEPGREYSYKIGVIDVQGEFFSPVSRATIPVQQLVLAQNSPNPFNPVTTIRFTMPVTDQVRLAVYDLNGRLVKTLLDEVRSFGPNEIEWDGTNSFGHSVSTGVYFYRLTAGKFVETRKMTLLK